MSIVIDANMKLFAERMGITSSRMIRDYGLKTVDEIIEEEASKGNTKAVNYAREMYHSPAKLIKIFKLTNVENKFVILHKMDDRTRVKVLPLLKQDDLVMGLYFFTQEKLLNLLAKVSMEELVNVALGAFALPEMVMMFTEDDMAAFFQNRNLEKYDVINELKAMPPDVMQKFVEGITGMPSDKTNPMEIINGIEQLPDDKFREFMSSIDPDVQRQLTFQLTEKKPEYLQLFPPEAYVNMLGTLLKQDMVKPMVALKKETLINMIQLLPDDLMAIVGAQVDTKKFAKFLLDGHLEVLERAMMI